MGLLSSSSKQTSNASQTTANADGESTSTSINVGGSGKGSTTIVNVEDLAPEVVGNVLDFAGASTALSIGFAEKNAALAYANLDATRSDVLGYLQQQTAEAQAERIRANDLAANIAARSLDLADEKTASTDDRVLSLGRAALWAGGGILALFLLVTSGLFGGGSKTSK